MSVFRDMIVLEGVVDVWEDMNQHGHRICKGIRAQGRVLGFWQETTRGLDESQIISSQQNLRGCYLVNLLNGNQREVCIVREQNSVLDEEHFLLWEGCKIVWWTGDNGSVVRVY